MNEQVFAFLRFFLTQDLVPSTHETYRTTENALVWGLGLSAVVLKMCVSVIQDLHKQCQNVVHIAYGQ